MSSSESAPHVDLNPETYPSLDIVLDLTREKLASQLSYVDALDTKASFVLGSATLLTAAAVAVRGTTHGAPGLAWLGLLAIGLYVFVVSTAMGAYLTRQYEQAPNPMDLEPYMWENVVRTKGDVT